ncbi:MAG: hypothetical protein U1E49_15930 [Hyphomicrobiaceae bacterium]
MEFLNWVANVLKHVVTPIYVLRAMIIAVVLASVMLALPDQTIEMYRSLALDRDARMPQIVLAFLSLTFAGSLIWYIGRNLTLRWQQDALVANDATGIMLRWLPRVLGATPLFAAAYGLWTAGSVLRPIDLPSWVQAQMPSVAQTVAAAADAHAQTRHQLYVAAGMAVALGLLLILATFLRSYRKHWKYALPNPWLFGLPIRLFFYALTFALVLLFSATFLGSPGRYGIIAEQLGAFTIFNLFVICLAFFLSFTTNLYDRTRFPALSLIVLMGIGSTAFDLNDNHEIRTTKRAFLPLPNAAGGFKTWLESRPDRAYFKSRGEPYPVYIVAAEGGGLYAAQHVAMTLARMQDRCGGFSQHIFAISGVSGGSLGSALFTSLASQKAELVAQPTCRFGEQKAGWFEERTQAFLARDFMSPLAAAGLFPDFLQRFVPWPFPAFDRARALEAAFERAWHETSPDIDVNPFADSFYDQWKQTGAVPALVLNTTHVQTGSRVVIAPFRFYRQSTARLGTLNSMVRADLPLSTAVGVSARFPWILPPASWRRGEEEQYRFVDGGYFESSGIDTALDLVDVLEDVKAQTLEDQATDLDFEVNLIVLTTDDILEDPINTANADVLRQARVKRSGFDELLSPVSTLLNARWERGVVSVARAHNKFCKDCFRDRADRRLYAGIDGNVRLMRLNFTDFELTLGWQLSTVSQTLVSAHSGYPDRCLAARPSLRDRWPWAARVLNENNCAACQMMYVLTGRANELDQIAPSITRNAGRNRAFSTEPEALPTWVQLCRASAGNPSMPTYQRGAIEQSGVRKDLGG